MDTLTLAPLFTVGRNKWVVYNPRPTQSRPVEVNEAKLAVSFNVSWSTLSQTRIGYKPWPCN